MAKVLAWWLADADTGEAVIEQVPEPAFSSDGVSQIQPTRVALRTGRFGDCFWLIIGLMLDYSASRLIAAGDRWCWRVPDVGLIRS